jgi:hypothetical protein
MKIWNSLLASDDISVTDCPCGTTSHPGTPRASNWLGIDQIDCLGDEMQEQHLTVDECDELAKALREDAAGLPHGPEREYLLQLAQDYRVLADMKRMVLRKVN